MTKHRHPEADAQRAIVHALRVVLPRGSIVHHSANEVTSHNRSAKVRQAILQGMGLHRGFADLIVLSSGRVLFLEVKSATGRLSPAQADFRDAVRDQGFAWALVRTVDDALGALAEYGFTARAKTPPSRSRLGRTAR